MKKISKTNKIILILGAFFILFTVLVAFLLKPKNEPSQELFSKANYIKDYEFSDGILKSQEAEFSLPIPEGWAVKDYDYKITLLSPEDNKNCRINVEIIKYKEGDEELNLQPLIDEVESGKRGETENLGYSLVNAGGRVFLKTVFKKDGQIAYILARTSSGNNIYHINSGLISSPDCVESFDKVLQTVKIDYDK